MPRHYEVPLKIRRFWLAAVGSISLLVLLLSLGADTFYGTNTIDKVYNTGSLVKGGKFIWKTLASMILNDDEKGVRKAMVAKYKDPRTGNWIPLTRRAEAIANAVNLAA